MSKQDNNISLGITGIQIGLVGIVISLIVPVINFSTEWYKNKGSIGRIEILANFMLALLAIIIFVLILKIKFPKTPK